MVIEYKTISVSDVALLPELGKEGWISSVLVKDRIVLYRPAKVHKRTKEEKQHTSEYLEFRSVYPSKTGIYADSLIGKYNALVKEGKHAEIMKGVEQYKKELAATGRHVANAETWINGKRWLEEFKAKKGEDDWMNPFLQKLPNELVSKVLNRVDQWRDETKKELTPGVLTKIISKYESS